MDEHLIEWLKEPIADCSYCEDPIRRDDQRGNVGGRLVHLRCAPPSELSPGHRDALLHLELVKVARDKFNMTPSELEKIAPNRLRPEWPRTVIPTEVLLAWAREEPIPTDQGEGR
jgi:hypothetical protein